MTLILAYTPAYTNTSIWMKHKIFNIEQKNKYSKIFPIAVCLYDIAYIYVAVCSNRAFMVEKRNQKGANKVTYMYICT